ncbi:uncharacterized protein LOC111570179 [Amphiprion ocellaris]|uniref:uncharacterized protein LOC111570179 n=1 Tax=Amphiprion ocellaris TaxID=80972 RepID=UPI002410ED7D|nr:uncharacterized protein LOC111570179 [Amphiprion ocellaris]
MKSDAKKQREFFEKKKMQQKLKNLGLALPAASPADIGPGSMDLVTLFIVNQIAAKKASTDPPKVAVLGSSKGGSKNKRNEPLVLPMSPCSPSQLSLVESQPQSSKTEAGDCAGHTANFSLNQPEDNEPILDFMLNQSETKQQFEEDVFSGFSHEEYEASHFGSAKSKIYLTDEKSIRSSTPQTVPDSQCTEVEFSNCTDMNFSCLGHHTGPMNGCNCSPNYSCGGGYYSSDSNDSSELCKCKKIPIKTQDAATQTAQNPTAETCDASTQCTFVAEAKVAPGLYLPPVGMSEQHQATERQTDTATEPTTLKASPEISSSEGKQMTWSNKKLKSSFRSGIMNIFPASNCGKMIRQRPINPFLDALSSGRGKEHGGGGDERGQHENPLKAPSDEGKEEVTSGTGVIGLSEEAETLQEIADILLFMKQRKKEG